MNDNCIFCKIVTGTLPSYKIYEDDMCVAFLDISPVAVGHALLIPKNHYQWMTDTPDDIVADCFVKTKKLMNQMRDNLGADYVQLSVVGKDVPHFHIHLIPRKYNDGLHGWATQNPDKKDLESVQKLIVS